MYNILLLCWLPILTSSLGSFLGQCGLFPLPKICLPAPPTCYSEVQQIESYNSDCCEAVCRGLPVPSGCPDCAVRRKPRKRIKKRPKRTIKRFKPTVDNEQPRIDDYDFDERPLAELDYHKSQDDDTCNSEKIRNIIKRETGTKTLTLKRNIQTLVEEELEDQFNVVCGKGQFSYITTTDEFCQETIDDTTCYVFKRNKIDDS